MACVFCWFGGLAIGIFIYQLLRVVVPWIYQNFIGPHFLGPAVKLKEMGEWALITGATEGIGKAYAKALANKGINVILVSRTEAKLNDVATEIETTYKVRTKVIAVDFTSGPEIYETITKNIYGLEIGILINNVGVSYVNPEYFLSVPNVEKLMNDIVTCNILSVTNMCRIVMPGMVDRNKGVIVNIASMSGVIPSPLLTIYSSSKAFVDKFSEDLHTEYQQKGIIVQSVLPGFVVSNMTRIKRPTWITPSADVFVASAIRTIGIARHTTGYYPHAIMRLVIDSMNALFPDLANKLVLRQMDNIRTRKLRKKIPSTE